MSNEMSFVTDKIGNRIPVTPVNVEGETLFTSASFKHFNTLFPTLDQFKSRESDIWICACPKSGSNWMGEIVHLLINGKACDKPIVEYLLDAFPSIDQLENEPSPRIMNTHIPFKYLPPQIKGSKIIYVVRNPLSVALSMYYHATRLPYMAYQGSPDVFLESFAISLFSFMGSWFDHVRQAYEASRQGSNVLLVFYEEVKENSEKSLKEISTFLGCDNTPDGLKKVAEQTTIDCMKDRFTKSPGHQSILGKPVPAIVFLRKGEVCEWRSHVSHEFLTNFMKTFEKEMKDYPELASRIKLHI